MSELKIFRASAGSGKTHRLTQEYLELLFDNPYNYKHILAVTFTNKATEEMKRRILKELNTLAIGEKSDYLEFIETRFSLSSKDVQEKAKFQLQLILHNFSRLSIETIDSFFQKCIRAFIRDLGIFSPTNLELDTNKVLSETIDELFTEIDTDSSLKKWLISFAEDKIKDGKSWNMKRDILQLSQEIYKEFYKYFDSSFSEKLLDKVFMQEYLKTITKTKNKLETDFAEIGEKGLSLISSHNLNTFDFSGSSKSFINYFRTIQTSFKEPTKTQKNAVGNAEKWYAKKSSKINEIITCYNNGLNDMLTEAVKFYEDNHKEYYTATAIRKYLHALGILTNISNKLKEYTKEQNIFLLADSSLLLEKIIGNSDTPFIYERIGNYYKHYMIDEFQDTSTTQWGNFKPLITNSLSENNKSLVVGDIKQSIYRWRNGNWKLLASQLENDFNNFGIEKHGLSNNWRSLPNIIAFNNSFFTIASKILQNELNKSIDDSNEDLDYLKTVIKDAYEDVGQIYPHKKSSENNGMIQCQFLEKLNWKETALEKLPILIEEIQDKGYKAKDIAILVSKNSEGTDIADHLLKYKNSPNAKKKYNYNVISNESLALNRSEALMLIVNVLRYLLNPNDKLIKSTIVKLHNSLNTKDKVLDNAEAFLFTNNEDFLKKLPSKFTNNLNHLKHLPLYEMIEMIIRLFNLNNESANIPYLNTFQDKIFDFIKTESSDIRKFIIEWDEKIHKESVSSNEHQDAIKLLTIHKSKGLEFKIVIMPFCEWKFKNSNDTIIWCKPNTKPFNKLEIVPLNFAKTLNNSNFSEDYLNEEMQNYIDNINKMYVAFTRAEEGLFTFSPLSNSSISNCASLLQNTIENASKYSLSNDNNEIEYVQLSSFITDENTKTLTIGSIKTKPKDETQSTIEIKNSFASNDFNDRLKIKVKANDFFNSDSNMNQQDKGTLMHELFSYIATQNDIKSAVNKLLFDGKINNNKASELINEIKIKLSKKPYSEWFSKKWDVKTEHMILIPDGKIKIPDRVMKNEDEIIIIDYKFGEKENSSFIKQISAYKDLITQMGYKNISAFIWYYTIDKIIEV